MIRYVLPIPSALRGALLDADRLYAYPTEPEPPVPNGFVVLDSGAFGLSLRKQTMNAAYLVDLAAHYRRYGGERVYCVAPDAYLNPYRSMQQWRQWHTQPNAPRVYPVIQATKPKRFDLYSVVQQCTTYGKHAVVFVSNPGLRGAEARSILPDALRIVRTYCQPRHIHILGAGWDRQDIADWRSIDGITSMDSIAYYTAAQEGVAWSGVAADDWRQTAITNAHTARGGIDGKAV